MHSVGMAGFLAWLSAASQASSQPVSLGRCPHLLCPPRPAPPVPRLQGSTATCPMARCFQWPMPRCMAWCRRCRQSSETARSASTRCGAVVWVGGSGCVWLLRCTASNVLTVQPCQLQQPTRTHTLACPALPCSCASGPLCAGTARRSTPASRVRAPAWQRWARRAAQQGVLPSCLCCLFHLC